MAYTPFAGRTSRFNPQQKPLVQPGNGLLGQIDEGEGLRRLQSQYPGAPPSGLMSMLQGSMNLSKQRRAAATGLNARGFEGASRYSPFGTANQQPNQ